MTSTADRTSTPDIGAGPPSPSPDQERGRRGLGDSYRRLWQAAVFSGVGDGIRLGALPLLAAALVPEPRAVAAVWFAGGLPFLLVGPVAGVLVDRWPNRRRIMWIADIVSALVVLAFAATVAAGAASIALLVVLNFLLGSVQTLRDNAELAVVPQLVGPSRLDSANSRLQGARLLTIDMLGPPLGALLFALPPGTPFLIDALTFGLAAILVTRIIVPRPAVTAWAGPAPTVTDTRAPAAPRSSIVAEIREGLRWLWRHRVLRTLCLLIGVTNFAVMAAMSIAVLYAFEVLHMGSVGYGVLLGVIALGGVLGSLVTPALARRVGRGATLRAAFGLAPIAFLIAATTSSPLVATLALTAVGALVGISNVIAVSMRQLLVPPGLLGRVNSSYRLVAVGLAPVGAVMGGVTAELFGLRAPFVLGALVLAVAWLLCLPVLTNRTLGRGPSPSPPPSPGTEPAEGVPAVGRSRVRRWLRHVSVFGLVALLVGLTAVAGFVSWTVRRSFPVVDGQVTVAGLHAQVEVARDRWGVPHISADDAHDLFLAQGYVHAQDRFWEMDIRRHITAGRLAELFGPGLVPTDAVVRTLGWYRVAEAELALLSPATRGHLQAYADGVNAYLAERAGAALSLEYGVLALTGSTYRPEPWVPADSVAWLKAMAWDLRTNLGDEIQRALMAAKLPVAMIDQLYPSYDFDRQRPIVDADPAWGDPARPGPRSQRPRVAGSNAFEAGARAVHRLNDVLGPGGSGIGSNSWVVAGDHTATGKPMLANDPHLGPSLPGIWYQMGLRCRNVSAACPFDVTGFGFSGLPSVIIGHNARVAWGLTNLGADVTDLFIEHVRGNTYEFQGRWLPLQTRREEIRAAGAAPTVVTVRATHHGPIISEVMESAGKIAADAIALRWTALEASNTMDAVFGLAAASDWTSFRAAAANFAVPSQNMVYADSDGHIGYQAPGRIPIRAAGDGRYPVPGWTGTHEWTGYVPFASLPSVLDPDSGIVVTANNAVAGPSYPFLLTRDWSDGYRSERIADLLATAGPLDASAMRRIQLDDQNPFAATLTPYLLDVPADDRTAVAQGLLRTWDHGQPVDSAAAAYFNAVWRHLLRLTFTDELAQTAADPHPDGGGRWFEVVRGLLQRADDPWWHNASDPRGLNSRDDVLGAAMDDAAAELSDRLGPDPARWRWGALHQLTLTHQTLGAGGPPPVQWLFNRGPHELAGGNAAVNANGWDARDGYAVDWGPSMRMVVDLSDFDASEWVNQTGASGHAFADNYVDQAELWASGRSLDWAFSAEAVRAQTESRLTLVPVGSAGSGA